MLMTPCFVLVLIFAPRWLVEALMMTKSAGLVGLGPMPFRSKMTCNKVNLIKIITFIVNSESVFEI